jgi:DNA-binding response OmpR family regulator
MSKPNLVVVADDAVLRLLLVEAFTDEGYAVRAAANGNDALALVTDDLPDALLLDLWLPDMDGQTMLTAMRQRGINVPCLILTDAVTETIDVAGLRVGVVTKPFDLNALLRQMAALAGHPCVPW